jgi:hypothetical protein
VLVAGAVIALLYAIASLVSRLRPGGGALRDDRPPGDSGDDATVIDLRAADELPALGQVG